MLILLSDDPNFQPWTFTSFTWKRESITWWTNHSASFFWHEEKFEIKKKTAEREIKRWRENLGSRKGDSLEFLTIVKQLQMGNAYIIFLRVTFSMNVLENFLRFSCKYSIWLFKVSSLYFFLFSCEKFSYFSPLNFDFCTPWFYFDFLFWNSWANFSFKFFFFFFMRFFYLFFHFQEIFCVFPSFFLSVLLDFYAVLSLEFFPGFSNFLSLNAIFPFFLFVCHFFIFIPFFL